MTIAIGIMGLDGIVVAADTEHTTGSYFKVSGSKILTANRPEKPNLPGSVCAISGTGDSNYLDSVRQEIAACFLDWVNNAKNHDPRELQKTIGQRVRDFYLEHVIPFASYPESDRPDFSLVIGGQFRHTKFIWSTEKTTIRMATPYAAVGTGESYANLLLNGGFLNAPVETMGLLAAYVIYQVKDCVPFCGKNTQIVLVKDNKPIYVRQETVDQMEELFQRKRGLDEELLRFILSSDQSTPWRSISAWSNRIRRELEKVRQSIFQKSKQGP